MPEVYVQVFRLGDGRWTYRLVVDGIPEPETGPADPLRSKVVTWAAERYPEHAMEVEEK